MFQKTMDRLRGKRQSSVLNWETVKQSTPRAVAAVREAPMTSLAIFAGITLAVAAGVYFYPELQRYLRMRRM